MARSTAPPAAVTVGAVLDMARAGRFRIPDFHRPFVWTLEQVVPFFESVIDGLPTGAIVVLEREAAAAEVQLGPLRIAAPPDPVALWVVDGAQRLGAIAGVLLAGGRPPCAFRLFYDLASDQVHARDDDTPTRIPLDVLTDVADLTKWLDEHEATAARFAEKVADLRERVLDYPLIVSRVLDPTGESAVEIFRRLNANGVALSEADLERARHPVADAPGPEPLADRLRSAGLGRLPTGTVVESVRAALGPGTANQDLMPGAFVVAEPALTAALWWLRQEGEIPHLVVWQEHLSLLPVLGRFFHLNRDPSARARILLRRWLWRAMGQDHGRVAADAYEAITGADSEDANRLLHHVGAHRPGPAYLVEVGQLLALSELAPRSLAGGHPLDVRVQLEIHGLAAFQRIGGVPILSPPDEGPIDDLVRAAEDQPDLLTGHALDRHMLARLDSGDLAGFRELRQRLLADRLLGISDRLAEWDASDRPSISALLVKDDDHDF